MNDKILKELSEVFGVNEISDHVYRIDTDFALADGTPLVVYVTVNGRKVIFSDEGALLESIYVPYEEELNTQQLDRVGATVVKDVSVVKHTTVRRLVKDLFKYLEAILETSQLYVDRD